MSAAKVLQPFYEDSNHPVIYGPLEQQPLGHNLGLNILGDVKVCAFDCVYCDLGRTTVRLNRLKSDVTLPSVDEVKTLLEAALRKIHTEGPTVDGIVISGNGEPALHPEFPEIVKSVLDLRGTWLPGKPVTIFTSGAGLDTRKTSDAMNLLDRRLVKFDAGNEKLFKIVNAPLSRTNLARVLSGVRKLRDVTIQSLFFEGNLSNTQATDIDDWIEVIAMIRPKGVYIYGLTRPIEGLVRCEQDTLYTIASRLERRTQIKAVVLP
jgi:wyosine [tRNA(Phe)-imidazoG37] synthetase (radical SAM superfamily)